MSVSLHFLILVSCRYLCCELTAKPWYRMPTPKYVHKLYEAFNKIFCFFLLQFNFSFMHYVFSRIKLIFAETPLSPPCLLFSPCFFFNFSGNSGLTRFQLDVDFRVTLDIYMKFNLPDNNIQIISEESNNEVINLWKYIKVCFHFVHQHSIRNKNGQQ